MIADLLEEVSEKNHVRVVKYENSKMRGHSVTRITHDELSKMSQAMPPLLMIKDQLRMLQGKKPIYLREALRRMGGQLVCVTPNTRVNVGIDFCANVLGGVQVSQADYIALSNNTLAIGATDTSNTLPWSTAQAADAAASGTTGEYTVLGVARKQATYAHTTGVTSYTQTATWTATGTVTALQKCGMFGGALKASQSNGATDILFVANTFTATSLANTDQLSLTWTINI